VSTHPRECGSIGTNHKNNKVVWGKEIRLSRYYHEQQKKKMKGRKRGKGREFAATKTGGILKKLGVTRAVMTWQTGNTVFIGRSLERAPESCRGRKKEHE